MEPGGDADDSRLRAIQDPVLSPLKRFTCTFKVELDGLHIPDFAGLCMRLPLDPAGPVKALNCNFFHAHCPGYAHLDKGATPPKKKRKPPGKRHIAPGLPRRERRPQGDGTCFNSSIEAIIFPDPRDPEMPPEVAALLLDRRDKYYHIRCFPSSGSTQIPGCLLVDFSDGTYVAHLWAAYLTRALGWRISVRAVSPSMLNYKFTVNRGSTRLILNLEAISDVFADIVSGERPAPFRAVSYVAAEESPKAAIHFSTWVDAKGVARATLVHMYQEGKINFLSCATPAAAETLYDYIEGVFRENWAVVTILCPPPPGGVEPAGMLAAPEAVPAPPVPVAARIPPEVLALDCEFAAFARGLYADLDQARLDEGKGDGEEDDQEGPL